MYRWLLRPILFCLSPAAAHEMAMVALGLVEQSASLRSLVQAALGAPDDERIAVRLMGLRFPSPLGLAAGFDKNARLPRAMAALGFGHVELGTVTSRPQAANPPPNLFRLASDRALVNRLGFPNDGAEQIAARLARVRDTLSVPVGVSIGKSRTVALDDQQAVIADYLASLRWVSPVADFVVINISSPNTPGLRGLQSSAHARTLLAALRRAEPSVRLLVKVAPDLTDGELEDLLAVVEETSVAGVVATNTTIARDRLATAARRVDAIGAGGLSGAPLRARAVEVVQRVRARLGRQAVVIGVGGVESAAHVLALMRAGADLVQMYTGLIYEGPGAPARIARELLQRVERGGVAGLRDILG